VSHHPDPSTGAPAEADLPPNHHGHHAGFSGLGGLVAALSMTIGRRGDAELAVDLAALRPGDHVVDVGCGPGTAVRLAASKGATAVGVDPATVMLDVARWTTWRRSGITWQVGSAEALPLPDASADVVWALSTVHHWPDVRAGVAEVARVLRAGGRFVAIEHRADPGAGRHGTHGWTEAQAETFAGMCWDAGLADVAVSAHTGPKRPALAVVAHRPTR
jgi:ubiquinone/menaquinone biosynthesis C-methylase UbiE